MNNSSQVKLINDITLKINMATWRNGYAEDCKSLYPSSILGVASIINCEILNLL